MQLNFYHLAWTGFFIPCFTLNYCPVFQFWKLFRTSPVLILLIHPCHLSPVLLQFFKTAWQAKFANPAGMLNPVFTQDRHRGQIILFSPGKENYIPIDIFLLNESICQIFFQQRIKLSIFHLNGSIGSTSACGSSNREFFQVVFRSINANYHGVRGARPDTLPLIDYLLKTWWLGEHGLYCWTGRLGRKLDYRQP